MKSYLEAVEFARSTSLRNDQVNKLQAELAEGEEVTLLDDVFLSQFLLIDKMNALTGLNSSEFRAAMSTYGLAESAEVKAKIDEIVKEFKE